MQLNWNLFSRCLAAGVIGLTAVVLGVSTSFAKKDDSVSPTQPKVLICHKGITISVAQAAVQAHLDHGDTLGACQTSTAAAVVAPPVAPQPAIAEAASSVPTVPVAPAVPVAPSIPVTVTPAPSVTPAVVPPTPAAAVVTPAAKPMIVTTPAPKSDEVTICFKGKNLIIPQTSIQDYIALGATLGRCDNK